MKQNDNNQKLIELMEELGLRQDDDGWFFSETYPRQISPEFAQNILNLVKREREIARLEGKIEVEDSWRQTFIMVGDTYKAESCEIAIKRYSKQLQALKEQKGENE